MNKLTVRDYDLRGKRVVVRVDYNVPVQNGRVGDELRIAASLDTLNYLLGQGCSLVLISHLGEPKGADPALSLAPVAPVAAKLLGRAVEFVDDCVGAAAEAKTRELQPGQVLLMENLRFHKGETANDPAFAHQLAALGEVYVDDAFAAAHRAHASLVGIPAIIPGVAGLLLEKEVDTITAALDAPERPLMAVIGGAKISSKIGVIHHLLEKVDSLLVGGAMANTFLAAQDMPVGQSLVELDQLDTARDIMKGAAQHHVQLMLPVDVVVTDKVGPQAKTRTVPIAEVTERDVIADVGPETIDRAADVLAESKTVIWNGPLGVTEYPEFAAASLALAHQIIDSGAQSLVGGGDTAAFIDSAGLHDQFDFVSTGGGASLELMAGNPLPAVEALLDKS